MILESRLENQPSDPCCFCLVVGQIIGGLLGIVYSGRSTRLGSPKVGVLVWLRLVGYSPWSLKSQP